MTSAVERFDDSRESVFPPNFESVVDRVSETAETDALISEVERNYLERISEKELLPEQEKNILREIVAGLNLENDETRLALFDAINRRLNIE